MQKSKTTADKQKQTTLGVVFLTLFLDLVGFSIIFPLFPALLDYYLPNGSGDGSFLGAIVGQLDAWAQASGADDPALMTAVLFGGFLGSVYSILQFICAPLWGALSDRIGRRRVLLISISGIALSYLLWFFGAVFWVFLLARILGGAMGGNISVATAAIADVTTREKRSRGLALVGIAFGLGFIVGPAIGGLSSMLDLTAVAPVLSSFGVNPFSVPALISFLLAVLNLFWVWRCFGETLPETKRRQTRDCRKYPDILSIFKTGCANIRRTNLLYLFFMIAFSGMEFTLTFLAVERFAFSPVQNGGMFVFIGLILIIVQGGLVRRLAAPVGEKRLAISGLFCGILSFLFLAVALELGLFFFALALLAFSIGLASPTLNALVSLYSSDTEQGANLGVFRSAGSLARAIGPLLAAFLYFSYGSKTTYLLGALIVLIPLLIAFTLQQPSKEREST